MKYVFILMLLVVGAAAGAWGAAIVVRWNDNMTQTARIVPGERVFSMPAGGGPRGGELVIPQDQRDVAAQRANPGETSPASGTIGRARYVTLCVPCPGPEGQGGTPGPVAAKRIPT